MQVPKYMPGQIGTNVINPTVQGALLNTRKVTAAETGGIQAEEMQNMGNSLQNFGAALEARAARKQQILAQEALNNAQREFNAKQTEIMAKKGKDAMNVSAELASAKEQIYAKYSSSQGLSDKAKREFFDPSFDNMSVGYESRALNHENEQTRVAQENERAANNEVRFGNIVATPLDQANYEREITAINQNTAATLKERGASDEEIKLAISKNKTHGILARVEALKDTNTGEAYRILEANKKDMIPAAYVDAKEKLNTYSLKKEADKKALEVSNKGWKESQVVAYSETMPQDQRSAFMAQYYDIQDKRSKAIGKEFNGWLLSTDPKDINGLTAKMKLSEMQKTAGFNIDSDDQLKMIKIADQMALNMRKKDESAYDPNTVAELNTMSNSELAKVAGPKGFGLAELHSQGKISKEDFNKLTGRLTSYYNGAERPLKEQQEASLTQHGIDNLDKIEGFSRSKADKEARNDALNEIERGIKAGTVKSQKDVDAITDRKALQMKKKGWITNIPFPLTTTIKPLGKIKGTELKDYIPLSPPANIPQSARDNWDWESETYIDTVTGEAYDVNGNNLKLSESGLRKMEMLKKQQELQLQKEQKEMSKTISKMTAINARLAE